MNARHFFGLGIVAVLASARTASAQVPNIVDPIKKAQNARAATEKNLSEQTGQQIQKHTNATLAEKAAAGERPGQGEATGKSGAAPKSGPGAASSGTAPADAPAALPPSFQPVTREVFSYVSEGRRDPFYSLILTEDLRPLITDLRLTAIMYDATGRRSIAIMRDLVTNAQYRVTTGMKLGHMQVAQIKPRTILFTIDEFGLNRTDSLFLADTSKTRIR
jgi:hypothetical protein